MKLLKIVGLGILALIILIIIWFIYCELNKAYWDNKVAQMCREDGGVIVYEKVKLTKVQAKNIGMVGGYLSISPKTASANISSLFTEDSTIILKSSSPKILKIERFVYKLGKDESIGKIVSYIRKGGDFPTVVQFPSSFSCPEGIEYYKIQSELFEIQGEK